MHNSLTLPPDFNIGKALTLWTLRYFLKGAIIWPVWNLMLLPIEDFGLITRYVDLRQYRAKLA